MYMYVFLGIHAVAQRRCCFPALFQVLAAASKNTNIFLDLSISI